MLSIFPTGDGSVATGGNLHGAFRAAGYATRQVALGQVPDAPFVFLQRRIQSERMVNDRTRKERNSQLHALIHAGFVEAIQTVQRNRVDHLTGNRIDRFVCAFEIVTTKHLVHTIRGKHHCEPAAGGRPSE